MKKIHENIILKKAKTSYVPMFGNKLLILLIVHCSLLIPITRDCVAQSITWQRTYQGPINRPDNGYDITYAPGGNFYFVGYSDSQIDEIYILKFNPFGDTIWSKLISGNGPTHDVYTCAMSNDSGCVITGNWSDSSFTIKLDRSGNIVWEKFYGEFDVFCYEIKMTADKGFIACGRGTTSSINGYVLKIDSMGNLEWQRFYPENTTKIYFSIEEDIGSGYVLTGGLDTAPFDSGKTVIDKIDYSGNIIWQKKYAIDKYSYGVKIRKINNDFIICGNKSLAPPFYNSFILKIDSFGNFKDSTIIPYNNYEFVDDFEIVNNNRYLLTLRQDSTINNLDITFAKVLILDSIFQIIHNKKFPSYRYTSFKSILPLSNGDILFGGSFDYSINWPNHSDDFYAVRTDSNLNCPPLPPIGNIGYSTEVPVKLKINQNFPNPFNPQTNITYEILFQSHVLIKVYDILGKDVATLINSNIKPGFYKTEFNGINLCSGIYIYTFFVNGNFYDTKKMILIK